MVVATDAASSPASAFDGAVATVGGASEKPSFIKGLLDSKCVGAAARPVRLTSCRFIIRKMKGRISHHAVTMS